MSKYLDSEGLLHLVGKIKQTDSSLANRIDTLDGQMTSRIDALAEMIETPERLATARSICTDLTSTTPALFDGSADVSPGVSGVLAVENGGTGASTAAQAIENMKDIIFDYVYPVGAVYMSFSSTSPASLFGGTWTQLTGRFLRMANDTSTGGADTVTLTVAQMPAHNHGGDWLANSGGTWNANLSIGGDCYVGGGTTATVGGGGSHNNMPAYQDVFAWRRTA